MDIGGFLEGIYPCIVLECDPVVAGPLHLQSNLIPTFILNQTSSVIKDSWMLAFHHDMHDRGHLPRYRKE
jgi:hypothetical protein